MVTLIGANTQKADLTYLRQVMREPLLSCEEESTLAHAWHDHHNQKALHQIIRAYSRLVISVAISFRYYGVPMSDLIQEGNLGLMLAAARFQPERGARFSTYAKWWVHSRIQDYILRNWSIVRTGSTAIQKRLFFNLRRLQAQFSSISTDILPLQVQEKIAGDLKVSIHDVENMVNRLTADLSLSHPLSEDGYAEWLDLLPDIRPTPEAETLRLFDTAIYKNWIKSALLHLTSRERHIILLRHLVENPMTLETIGIGMGISKERVRQVERKSLHKMHLHLLKNIRDIKEIF